MYSSYKVLQTVFFEVDTRELMIYDEKQILRTSFRLGSVSSLLVR